MATNNSKITMDELTELSQFWSDQGDALSVYFKAPAPPSELTGREDRIYAKDKIKEALGRLRGSSPAQRQDIQRLIETMAEMKGNGRRAKVIFACGRETLWREYDVPGDFAPRVEAGSAFTLAPLIAQQQGRRRYCITLADRNRGRLLLLEAREITEHSQVLDEEKEKIRTTGARKSGHLERKKEQEALRHFAFLADHLLHFYEHGDYDRLIVGCRDEMWPEIEQALHANLRRILAGRFLCDPGLATSEEIQEKSQAIVDARDREEEIALVDRTVGAAAADALGAVGLNAVIDALEKGEVRTLLWQDRAQSQPQSSGHHASLCENCGHLEADGSHACTLCGARMRRFADAEEALLRHALGRSIEVRQLHYAKLPPPDAIAAWLRYRAEMNTAQALAS